MAAVPAGEEAGVEALVPGNQLAEVSFKFSGVIFKHFPVAKNLLFFFI